MRLPYDEGEKRLPEFTRQGYITQYSQFIMEILHHFHQRKIDIPLVTGTNSILFPQPFCRGCPKSARMKAGTPEKAHLQQSFLCSLNHLPSSMLLHSPGKFFFSNSMNKDSCRILGSAVHICYNLK